MYKSVLYLNKKGSILILSLILMFLLLTLALSIVAGSYVSEHTAVRSGMSAVQFQAVQISLQRFLDAFSSERRFEDSPPVPDNSQVSSKPAYDIPFEISPKNHKGFSIQGRWKQQNSIYYPAQGDSGKDFTVGVEGGYYDKITAPAYKNHAAAPGYNMVVLNTPLNSRYLAVFQYHFPYGAFAPSGQIKLKDVYGTSNPIDDINIFDTNFPTGESVSIFAKNDIQVTDFPCGKAYSQYGTIEIMGKRGAVGFTETAGVKLTEADSFRKIIQDQIEKSIENLTKISLNKDGVIFGKPVNNIYDFIKGLSSDFLTLEQSADFVFAGMTGNDRNPKEKTMGNHYRFHLHAPYIADSNEVNISDSKVDRDAREAYDELDTVLAIFKHYRIPWKQQPTEACLAEAEILLAKDIFQTAVKLAKAIAGLPKTAIQVALLTAKMAKLTKWEISLNKFVAAFTSMRSNQRTFDSHLRGTIKAEPRTVEADRGFNNSGWPYIKTCGTANQKIIMETLGAMSSSSKYNILGDRLIPATTTKYRMAHFGKGLFENNFKNINKENFVFNGTFTVPRGRTFRCSGNLTVNGDIWIQDGGSLYIQGNLTLNPPSSQDPAINKMMQPSGRIFLGVGSTVITDGDFKCAGSKKLGSVIVDSPADRVYEITSGIISIKGSVYIPFGIMPGISVDKLADSGSYIPAQKELIEIITNNAANISKAAGPFYKRKAFFAKYPASVLVFRHKDLAVQHFQTNYPIVLPLKRYRDNLLNNIFAILTEAFTFRINAHLGENFFTHSDWWIFGEGVIPILPKMKVHETAPLTTGLMGAITAMTEAAALFQAVKLVIPAGHLVVSGAEAASKATGGIYGVFLTSGFVDCDGKALNLAKSVQSAADAAYLPFSKITQQADSFRNAFADAKKIFNSFYSSAYPIIEESLPGGDTEKPFTACPGILIYAGKDINMGEDEQSHVNFHEDINTNNNLIKEEKKEDKTKIAILPSSGLFLANNDVNIKGNFRHIGCIISFYGNIFAEDTKLRFYPYFTRASLYTPKDVGGNLDVNMKLVSDKDLLSDKAPQDIGITLPAIRAEGWDLHSEYSK